MLFRQIVFYALMMGALAGAVLTVVQKTQVVPIILSAEMYERETEIPLAPFKTGAGHSHAADTAGDADAWAPTDGVQRTVFTLISNVLTAIGFALLTLVAMKAMSSRHPDVTRRTGWRYGLLWGAAGFAVFWLAPALGVPPEIPLVTAAPLEARQLWWLLAVLCTAGGLAGLVFGRSPWRWAFALLILVPHVIGAPHHVGAMFADQPPEAAAALEALARQFIWASALANAALWAVLGLAGSWALRRIVVSEGTHGGLASGA